MKFGILLSILIAFAGSVSAETTTNNVAAVKNVALSNQASEVNKAQRISTVNGRVLIQGNAVTIKNTRNSYLASGKALEEFKQFENTDVHARGYLSEENGTKKLLVTSLKGQVLAANPNNSQAVNKLNK